MTAEPPRRGWAGVEPARAPAAGTEAQAVKTVLGAWVGPRAYAELLRELRGRTGSAQAQPTLGLMHELFPLPARFHVAPGLRVDGTPLDDWFERPTRTPPVLAWGELGLDAADPDGPTQVLVFPYRSLARLTVIHDRCALATAPGRRLTIVAAGGARGLVVETLKQFLQAVHP